MFVVRDSTIVTFPRVLYLYEELHVCAANVMSKLLLRGHSV
jgi:hypothetical protein